MAAPAWRAPSGAARPRRGDAAPRGAVARESSAGSARTIRDLLEHRPHRYEEPVPERPIADVLAEEEVAIAGEVLSVNVRRPRRRLALVEARVSDGTGAVKATWFNQAWLAEKLQPGTRVRLRGSLGRYGFTVKSYDLDGGGATADFAPVYPATEDLTPKRIRELVSAALDLAGGQWDPLPAALRLDERLPSRSDALSAAPALVARGGGNGPPAARVRRAARLPAGAGPAAGRPRDAKRPCAPRARRARRPLPDAAPIHAHRGPRARDHRDRRRPREAETDGAAVAGRRRLG